MERLPGFRDFYPEPLPTPDAWSADARAHIFSAWRETARRYGFREYDGPPLEDLELYIAKSGAEIVGQLYNFKDKGDRDVALRPEMTPTLARMIAATIRGWLDGREPLESEGRPIHPGDILILVRRRNAFVDDLVRALKKANIPIAGVDRMVLPDQLAVMDLVALGRVLLLPQDDLTLASVLKGPLFALTEEQLLDLAHGRRGNLWAQLRARGDIAPYEKAWRELSALRERADFVAPFELYSEILNARGGRSRLLATLGDEADDPIDEFLAAALAYERDHPPSLEGFLHWLERGRQEIKRDPEVEALRAVRIMTVHGAKGLQAPIVFLPDTMQAPREYKTLFWRDDLVLWSPRGAEDSQLGARMREDAGIAGEAEHCRLLYVAMTRASDRLYICGYRGPNEPPPHCWYNRMAQAMERIGTPFDFRDPAEGAPMSEGRRVDSTQTKKVGPSARATPPDRTMGVAPAWWGKPAPAEPEPPRPLTPSAPEGVEPPVRSPLAGDDGARFQRGRLIQIGRAHV